MGHKVKLTSYRSHAYLQQKFAISSKTFFLTKEENNEFAEMFRNRRLGRIRCCGCGDVQLERVDTRSLRGRFRRPVVVDFVERRIRTTERCFKYNKQPSLEIVKKIQGRVQETQN